MSSSITSSTAVRSRPVQGSFDELGRPLRDVTFVVVDLETTGSSAADHHITEIGAVKVRGGEVLGTFATLVRPPGGIPPFISVLTGITDRLVAPAPTIEQVLPAFLEFAAGTVWVAHNSPFDLGFLRAACAAQGLDWPAPESLDTARLARRVLTRDEAPDCRLATLARVLRTAVEPCHRALADAQATVDVLHTLIGRVGSLGVHSLEELRTFSTQVTPEQRRKRHLAEPLPHAPGVYLFRDARGRVLYVGTSRDLRSRVRHYFVASEERSRMAEMVGLAERVDHLVCAHALEAEVRELRLIAEHAPRYNRRDNRPERAVWVKLTVEPFPRLSVVRRVRDDGASYLGPFASSRRAELAVAAVHAAVPLRQCTPRLSPRRTTPACVLFELGRCGAPCEGRESPSDYAGHVELVRAAFTGDPGRLVERLEARVRVLGFAERYEDAARERDRVRTLVQACARVQRLSSLTRLARLVAARPRERGGWELVVVDRGRLVAAGVVPGGAAPRPYVEALCLTAEVVPPGGPGPTPCALASETERILRWLDSPGTRLVECSTPSGDGWSSPAGGAARLRRWLGPPVVAGPATERRPLRPHARPARSPGAHPRPGPFASPPGSVHANGAGAAGPARAGGDAGPAGAVRAGQAQAPGTWAAERAERRARPPPGALRSADPS